MKPVFPNGYRILGVCDAVVDIRMSLYIRPGSHCLVCVSRVAKQVSEYLPTSIMEYSSSDSL